VLSSGSGLHYARGAYQGQFGKTTAGLSYSDLRYALGREFESLGAHGSQQITSLYASHPLTRSQTQNLSVGLNLDFKRFEDVVDTTSSLTHKHANVLSASLRGDASDKRGSTLYGLTWATGRIDLKDASLQAMDAVTAKTQGHFNKLSFNANRLQKVSDTVSVYASLNGQVASKNLDVSEKMELGGMYGVRAFPEGEAFADQGYLFTLESRLQLNSWKAVLPGQLQIIGFVDTGTVRANQTPWTAGDNRRTLSGAGIGLNWSQPQNYMVRAYYAFKLGNQTAQSAPDAKGRFWVQGVKYF
jgi:hemolysin activation/secretion protein